MSAQLVVAPSLTPDSYTAPTGASSAFSVVAPSLTPDSYTQDAEPNFTAASCSSLSHPG